MKLISALMIVCVGLPALAIPVSQDSPLTSVASADLWCGDAGGGFYVDTKGERAWQGDPGVDEGLELSILKFERLRCPGCFNILADLNVWGSVLHWDLRLRGKKSPGGGLKVRLKAKGSSSTTDEEPAKFNYECSVPASELDL